MGERGDAWKEAAEYAASVAGVGEQAAHDRGVSVARVERMQGLLDMLRRDDPDAFYVCVNRYATEAAQAVARCLAVRAESEAEREMQDEPTNPHGFVVPPEARGEPRE
jgi:hypothetical protein